MNNVLLKIKNFIISDLNENIDAIDISKYHYSIFDKEEKIYDNIFSVSMIYYLLDARYIELEKIFSNNSISRLSFRLEDKNVYLSTKIRFIEILEMMIEDNLLSQSEIKKYNKLKSKIEYDSYIKSNAKKYFFYFYNQNKKSILTKKIIKSFKMKNEDFKEQLEKGFFNLSRQESLIIFLTFIDNYINDFYTICNDDINKNYKLVLNLAKKYNISNKILLQNKPDYMDKVEIDETFQNNILKKIPEEFSSIEKAFYTYLILCKTLTYDVIEVNGKRSNINHSDINRLKLINEENNVILCYEFIAIYAKFLEKFGIEYEFNRNEKYGRNHIKLYIKYKNSKIEAEPTMGAIDCDLTNAKMGIKLKGFNFNFSNQETYDEIQSSINKVYNYIKIEEQVEYKTQKELIEQKRKKFNLENKDSDLKERFEILLDKLINSNLPPVEIIKELRILKKVIFEDLDMFRFYLITSNDEMYYPENAKIILILVFNPNEIDFETDNYYIYKYPHTIQKIDKDTLQSKFDLKELKYIDLYNRKIPGISNEKAIYKKKTIK